MLKEIVYIFAFIFAGFLAGCDFSDNGSSGPDMFFSSPNIGSPESGGANVVPWTGNGTEKPFVPDHAHEFVCTFIGGDPVCHKVECSVCGFVYNEKEQCQSSFFCKDCGHSTNQSKYKTDFFEIKENITELYVIANKGFENSQNLKNYIEYKKARGFSVTDKYYGSDTDPKDIRSYLKNEYEKDASRGMAVLLVGKGGSSGLCIPEFVNKNQPEIQGKKRVAATDFWYGFYEEKTEDLFPQAMVGRLSACNEEELKAMVNKIIKTESGQSSGQQNKNILLVQQKDSAGKTPFSDESADVQKYFSEKHDGRYNVKLAYTTEAGKVNSSINEGALMISYSGHGGPDFWGDSRYNVNHIKALRNDFYPVVLGITCNSANYTYGNECVAEAFMRNSSGGASGYIGASSVMIADFSKTATLGFQDVCGIMKSVFPDNGASGNYKVTTLGGMHLAALRAIRTSRIPYSDVAKGYSIEILNLFGDPTMSIEYMQ